MDEESRPDMPEPEEISQEEAAAAPPEESQPQPSPVGPRPGGPAQVAGCWLGLVILAALVVFVVLTIGRQIRTASEPAPSVTSDVDQDGLGGGDLKSGEAYKGNVLVRILGFDRYVPASQQSTESSGGGDTREAPSEGDSGASAKESAKAQASQPAAAPEAEYIVSGEVTNLKDKEVTYLKVHLVLKDASGETIGETWHDVATARPSIRYIRSFGSVAPKKTRSFQSLISVAPDAVPASASADIVALAVK